MAITGGQLTTVVSGTPTLAPGDHPSLQLNTSGQLLVSASVTATTGAVATAAAPTYVEGSTDPLSMDLSGGLRVTGTINATSAAMATAANPSYSEGTSNPFSQDLSGHLRVTGTFWQTTQPVNVAQVNGVTVLTGAGATGTGAQRVTASQDTTTIAGSAPGTAGTASPNVVTIQGIASMTKLLVTPDANSPVNVAQINGHTTLEGGVNGSVAVGGTAASGASVTGNPLLSGARAATANPTAVTDGQVVALMADVLGKLVTTPYAPRALTGAVAVSATDNSSHTLIGAGASGVYNDILSLTITNTSATTTYVTISDGTASYVYAAVTTDTRGQTFTLPRKATSTATAWTYQVTTGETTIYVSADYIVRTG